jgi:Domain of unknown function (DUF4189)
MNVRKGWVVLAAISAMELVGSRTVRADAAIAIADWGIAGAASGSSRQHAATLAVEECRRKGGMNCRPVASVEEGCIAIAISSAPVCFPHTGVATSWSRDMAKREAQRKCSQEYGTYRCRIDASACDQHDVDARPAICDRGDREDHRFSCTRPDDAHVDPPVKQVAEARPTETHIVDPRTQTALYDCQQKAAARESGEYACSGDTARNLFVAMSYEKIEPTIVTTTEGMLLKRTSPSGIVTCWLAVEQYTAKEHLPVDQYECRIKHKLSDW